MAKSDGGLRTRRNLLLSKRSSGCVKNMGEHLSRLTILFQQLKVMDLNIKLNDQFFAQDRDVLYCTYDMLWGRAVPCQRLLMWEPSSSFLTYPPARNYSNGWAGWVCSGESIIILAETPLTTLTSPKTPSMWSHNHSGNR